jgi:putative heme-binding domain-containing protein
MITGQTTYPAIAWPEQAYVQIDLVGQFTAAAGCAVYEGGAWPDKWRYAYFTGEPTLNIVHQQFVRPDGVSYSTEKETGREETEFIRSSDLWFRPIETRVGPDGALYVVDFYNQAVIHNDTRGPLHGPANAAVRPDRDHFFGRIWRVQHKQAKKLDVPALNRRDLPGLLRAMETSPNAHVKQTAWRLAHENFPADARVAKLQRPMGSKALELYEKTRRAADPAQRRELLDTFARATDNWTKSAIAAGASETAPAAYVTEAFAGTADEDLGDLIAVVAPNALPAEAPRLLAVAAKAPPAATPLRAALARAVAQMSGTLTMDAATTDAVGALLADPGATAATLPIVAKWDTEGKLKDEAEARAGAVERQLDDVSATDDVRAEAAGGLISLPSRRRQALPKVEALLAAEDTPNPLKTKLVAALARNPGPDVDNALIGAATRTRFPPIFDQIMRRPESTVAVLDALEEGRITLAQLGPGNVARLRTHPRKQMAERAAALIDRLTPNARERAEAVAALAPAVEQPGDTARGKALFTGACATCHKLGDIGKEVGPPLNGMGVHARSELLNHIIDPNREVDPSYWQWNVTTKTGESLVGVIASENATGITLRSQAGDVEIKEEDIATRENTRRSLMPEGFDSLGAEALRDILSFIAAGDQRFRIVDIRQAYTASSRRGFRRDDDATETVPLHRFGDVTVNGVPFFVMDPGRSPNGTNLIALKGGPGGGNASDEFARRVEIPMTGPAASLHFLGGVGLWAWPGGGDAARGQPVMKVVVQFADGTAEEHVLKNGEQFADALVRANVPLSSDAGDFTGRGQLRYFAINLSKKAPLAKLTLESYDTDVVPVTVAITASEEPASAPARTPGSIAPAAAPAQSAPAAAAAPAVPAIPPAQSAPASAPAQAAAATPAPPPQQGPKEGGKGDAPLPETKPIAWAPGKAKVLVIGGGSSHNFGTFFGGTDVATLAAAGFSVNYTEDRDQAAAELRNADVAVISVNRQFFDTPEYRKALFDFAAAGKGLVMLHPGTWYGYANWPELNARIVGGGARGHDRIAKFSVNTVKADHPVMKGVPASFEVEDELYYMNAEADKIPPGTSPVDVLAETSPSVRYKQPHPSVWITQHPTARIVGIALGHDERVHDLAAFRILLTNAVTWAARPAR